MMQPRIRQRERGERAINITPSAEEIAELARTELQTHEGRIYVKRASYGDETEGEEKIYVPLFGASVARVGISASSTRNLGDYNSAKVEVHVELPCYPELSEIRRASALASAILDELIPVELQKAGVPIEQS